MILIHQPLPPEGLEILRKHMNHEIGIQDASDRAGYTEIFVVCTVCDEILEVFNEE